MTICPTVNLEIYRDRYYARYYGLALDWHAHSHESMGHYYKRIQDAMLPHAEQDLYSLELHTLYLRRERLSPEIRRFVPCPYGWNNIRI